MPYRPVSLLPRVVITEHLSAGTGAAAAAAVFIVSRDVFRLALIGQGHTMDGYPALRSSEWNKQRGSPFPSPINSYVVKVLGHPLAARRSVRILD